MAELFNITNRFGVTYTSPSRFANYNLLYTIRKRKYGKQMTFIGFYDNVSNSLRFGFRVRKFKTGLRYVYCNFDNGYQSKEPIPSFVYKELIERLKANTKFI